MSEKSPERCAYVLDDGLVKRVCNVPRRLHRKRIGHAFEPAPPPNERFGSVPAPQPAERCAKPGCGLVLWHAYHVNMTGDSAEHPFVPPSPSPAAEHIPEGVRWNAERGHYEEEFCPGCHWAVRLRGDCGCPCGTAWRKWIPSTAQASNETVHMLARQYSGEPAFDDLRSSATDASASLVPDHNCRKCGCCKPARQASEPLCVGPGDDDYGTRSDDPLLQALIADGIVLHKPADSRTTGEDDPCLKHWFVGAASCVNCGENPNDAYEALHQENARNRQFYEDTLERAIRAEQDGVKLFDQVEELRSADTHPRLDDAMIERIALALSSRLSIPGHTVCQHWPDLIAEIVRVATKETSDSTTSSARHANKSAPEQARERLPLLDRVTRADREKISELLKRIGD